MWNDADMGADVAISFQEVEGAELIWRVLLSLHQPPALSPLLTGATSSSPPPQ
jgi:hypothetical protein